MNSPQKRAAPPPFQLTVLPWSPKALAPVVSEETIRTHHGKHHAGYVEKANTLAEEAGLSGMSAEEIILHAHGKPPLAKLFANAAQAWNHDFYWHSLTPAPLPPRGELRSAIATAFGSLPSLVTALVDSGVDRFGSGWVWLVNKASGGLAVRSTSNADSPLVTGERCLLTLDVWEHAYYLDYRQDRKAHLKAIVEGHAHWAFAESRLTAG